MNYIIVDIDKLHALGLWKRVCLPHGFYPDIFIVENITESIVSFIDELKDSVVALPISFQVRTVFQTSCTLIVHEKSRNVSSNQIQVSGIPASACVIDALYSAWRNQHEHNKEVYKK